MLPLRIIATGKALPTQRVHSHELDARFGFAPGTVQRKSGVQWRHHASAEESQSGLGAQALNDALARGGIAPQSIDLLLSTSGVQEQALPTTAARILSRAGLPAGTPGIDIGASCIGFIASLHMAACLLQSGSHRRIAIVAADLASRGIDWDDAESAFLFGDGAAAVIVERADTDIGIDGCKMETYPEGVAFCEIRAGGTRRNPRAGMTGSDFLFHMDGKRVFKLASSLIDGFVERLLDQSRMTLSDVDLVVPHQASHLSMKHAQKRLGLRDGAVVDIYATHGNQVAASIPTALHEAIVAGRVRSGSRVLLLGSAAGLTLGGLVLRT